MIEVRSGKMPTTSVRRRTSLLSRSSELFDQSCRQCSFGKPVKASRSGAASSEQRSGFGKARLELLGDAGVLLVHRLGVGLGENRAHHRRDEALRRLGDAGQEVAHEVGAAALPTGPRQRRGDRVDEAGVGIAREQADARQAASDKRAQEGEPGSAVLGGDDVEPERLAEAVAVDGHRVHDAGIDGPTARHLTSSASNTRHG